MINLVVNQLPKPIGAVLSGLPLQTLAEPKQALKPINDAFGGLFSKGNQFTHLPYFPPRPVVCCPPRPFPLNPTPQLQDSLNQIKGVLDQILAKVGQSGNQGSLGDTLQKLSDTLTKNGISSRPGISDGSSRTISIGESSSADGLVNAASGLDNKMAEATRLLSSDKLGDQIKGQILMQQVTIAFTAISDFIKKQTDLAQTALQNTK